MKSNFSKQGNLTIILIIISALTLFAFSSCSKEDININETVPNDNYYVKYIIKGNSTYSHFSNWIVTTPQGKYTNSGIQVKYWSQTYGPVNKGFKCDVQIGNFISGAPIIEIHVAKNQEPFALKENKTGNSASYIINY